MRMKAFDGRTWVIYQIEAQFPETASEHYRKTWYTREMTPRDFGERWPKHNEDWDKACPLYKNYTANGQCWQRTGLNGYFDGTMAVLALARILKFAPPCKSVVQWRLVKRVISVEFEEIAKGKAPLVTT